MKPDAILQAARDRMAEAYDGEKDNRERDFEDRRFATGDQWDEAVRQQRELEGKPCITINGVSQYLRQVTAQVRQLNPAIKVSAADNQATEEVAEIYEGIIRHIEQRCDASSVYEFATENAATGGIGYWRVRADYADESTFDQELMIERVYNPFSVFVDPLARHPARMDMRYCFVIDEMHKDEFAKQYPGKKHMDLTTDHRPLGSRHWTRGENVVVAEYFWIEHEKVRLGLLKDGTVIKNPPAPLAVVKTRTAMRPKVKWAKITHDDILEGPSDIPSRYIPVFAVTGEEIHVGEEVYRSGVIRHAKDPAMLYNFAWSSFAETNALQPKAPYIGTLKQFDGLQEFWNEANTKNRPYLPYNPDEKAPGPPQRQMPPVPSSAWMTQLQLAAEDMKRTTGIYDAGLGAQSNETSGVAINARKMESQAATSVYADNMVKAINHCGRVLVEMIPHIYDTQRTIRILGANDQEQQVMINSIMVEQGQAIPVNDLGVGRYDVRVSVGPAYETLRAEAREGMMQFLNAIPNAGQVTADLVADAQDWPNADQFAERLKKILPPGIADEEDDDAARINQAVQQQLQQIVPQLQAEMAQSIEAQKAQVDLRKSGAEASEAESDAEKARFEVMEQQLETMAKTGQLDAMIGQLVQQEVMRALQGAMQPAPVPMQQPGPAPY